MAAEVQRCRIKQKTWSEPRTHAHTHACSAQGAGMNLPRQCMFLVPDCNFSIPFFATVPLLDHTPGSSLVSLMCELYIVLRGRRETEGAGRHLTLSAWRVLCAQRWMKTWGSRRLNLEIEIYNRKTWFSGTNRGCRVPKMFVFIGFSSAKRPYNCVLSWLILLSQRRNLHIGGLRGGTYNVRVPITCKKITD